MRCSVFGLGYVGAVSAACLADLGHDVIGVDPQPSKVDALNEGRSPVVEPDLDELMRSARAAGRLRATDDALAAVRASDLALVCVGTPSRPNGDLDLTFIERVCQDIGEALQQTDDYFVVVVRSTMLPGTTEAVVVPTLEKASGRVVGEDLGVCVMPEFLREGTAVADFLDPAKVVVGASDDRARGVAVAIAHSGGAPVIHTDLPVAETVKYVDNAWHALKVAFANEIGTIARGHEVDAHRVMDIFCADEKLNLSARYLRPGPAFGGSCLPKDLRALTYRARRMDIEIPVLSAILDSNQRHLDRVFELVTGLGARQVGVLGLSFKAGTDDLRESPMVHLVERLLGKGFDVRIHDPNVRLAQLAGANRDYLLARLPHVARLLVDTVDAVLDHADTVVIGVESEEARRALRRADDRERAFVDLVRLDPDLERRPTYHGICW